MGERERKEGGHERNKALASELHLSNVLLRIHVPQRQHLRYSGTASPSFTTWLIVSFRSKIKGSNHKQMHYQTRPSRHNTSSQQSSHLSTAHPCHILILTTQTSSCKLPTSRSSARASQTSRAVSSSVLGRGPPSPAEEYEEVEERSSRSTFPSCCCLSSTNTLPVSCS